MCKAGVRRVCAQEQNKSPSARWWARGGGAHLKHTVHTTALQASLRALFLELGTYTCTKARPLLSVTVLYAYYKAFACKMHYKYLARNEARTRLVMLYSVYAFDLLDMSKVSGWLKATAHCRTPKQIERGHCENGVGCKAREGRHR